MHDDDANTRRSFLIASGAVIASSLMPEQLFGAPPPPPSPFPVPAAPIANPGPPIAVAQKLSSGKAKLPPASSLVDYLRNPYLRPVGMPVAAHDKPKGPPPPPTSGPSVKD